MAEQGLEEKTIRVIQFHGDKTQWRKWSTKHLILAHKKGHKETLTTKDKDLPDKEDELSKDETILAKETKALAKNAAAYSDLVMALEDETSFEIVINATTKEYPSGLARLVWTRLEDEYEPKDRLSRIELRNMLMNVTMDDTNTNPESLFMSLRHVQHRYERNGQKLEEDDLITQAMRVAPTEYRSVISAKLSEKGDNMTLEDLRKCMREFYRMKELKEDTEEKGNETALVVFKGLCRTCGKQGHKSYQCPDKKA
jgi:hypothetical protein